MRKILKKWISMLIAAVICFSCSISAASSVQVRSAPLTTQSQAMNGMVRVWLSSLGSPSSLNLTIKGNYSLSSSGEFLSNGTRMAVSFNSSTGAISISYNGQRKSVGKSFSLRRHSTSGTNGILIAESRESQNPYPGDLSFEAVANGNGYRLYVIAHVYIENYLYGVVPYEMGNSTSIEALKAQAVAARTYTVRMMKSRASGRYDVQDTTSDQSYRGTPSGNANCVAAIDQTKGIVLMYGSSYITTYYSASNGGQTETSRSGTSYAYLPVKDDPFDYANTSSTVRKKTIYTNLSSSSNPSALISLLKTKAISRLNSTGYSATQSNTTLKTLKSITPHTPKYNAPSRLYTKMDFTFTVSTQNTSGQTVTVTQTVTCDIFNELESMLGLGIQSSENELWSVESVSGGLQIQARRYGHGMGMSQRGAMYMAKLGYTYDEILGFYYENCSRVRHSFTSSILSESSSNQEITVEDAADLETDSSASGRGRVSLSGISSKLAIRASRSTDEKILTMAPNGAIVEVLSSEGGWCLIRYGEIVGYVPADTLVVTGEPTGDVQMVTNAAGFVTVTANDYVNLRASGSMSGKVLGTAPAGAVLTVLETGNTWLKVQYDALAAYVNSGYVSALMSVYPAADSSDDEAESEDETDLPNDTDEDETAEDETGDTAALTAVVATEYGSLNMRAEGFAGSLILTTIPKGETIEVEECGSVWSRVFYEGMSGYVMSYYLLFDAENGADDVFTDEDETSATVTTPGGTLNLRSQPRTGSEILYRIPQYALVQVHQKGPEWSHVTYQGITGYVMTVFLSFSSANIPETEPEEHPSFDSDTAVKEAKVTTASGSLNLRSEPSVTSRVLASIPRLALVEVLEYDFEWCRIQYQYTEGYAMTQFLTLFESEEETETPELETPSEDETVFQYAYVQTSSGGLNLRAQPGSSYLVLTTIPRNAMVTVTRYSSDWCAVRYDGYEGFVMTSYLSFDAPEEEDDTVSSGWEDEEEQEEQPLEQPEYPIDSEGPQTDPTLRIPDRTLHAMNTSGDELSLWSMCWKAGAPLGKVPVGETVEVILLGDTWCCVTYESLQGYCLREELSVLNP